MMEASDSATVLTRQRRIALLAGQSPQMALTSLNHHLDVIWLREAFRRTRKTGAPGIDGQTWQDYERDLETNLQSLLERVKSGTYRAPAVRREWIPKGSSPTERRPIGVPTIEDKVLQRAIVMLLEPLYRWDFLPCSYGFIRGRSAHQALEAFRDQARKHRARWVLDVDVQKFFDTLDHGRLREFLQRRMRDGVVLRLIGKWLNAGVLEDGVLTHPDTGSPQGGVISPLLANVYLHYVLDVWFHDEVLPRLQGQAFLVRFADDFVIGFTRESDAQRVLNVLPKRFSKYGLTVHPDKTRLVPFHRPGRDDCDPPGPGTFQFLGFTHYWAKSRKGHWVIKRRTASDRFRRSLRAASEWCRKNRHLPLADQHRTLSQKLRGFCSYYGITGNSLSLAAFRRELTRIWRKWLLRRNNRRPNWIWFNRLLSRYPLPPARAIHSIYHVATS